MAAGHVLAREGETGTEFYVIVEGRAEATRGGKRLNLLGRGQFFGEISLLDHGPRVATVVAQTPMLLLVLSSREFDELIEQAFPSGEPAHAHGLGERLRQADERVVRGAPRLAGV